MKMTKRHPETLESDNFSKNIILEKLKKVLKGEKVIFITQKDISIREIGIGESTIVEGTKIKLKKVKRLKEKNLQHGYDITYKIGNDKINSTGGDFLYYFENDINNYFQNKENIEEEIDEVKSKIEKATTKQA